MVTLRRTTPINSSNTNRSPRFDFLRLKRSQIQVLRGYNPRQVHQDRKPDGQALSDDPATNRRRYWWPTFLHKDLSPSSAPANQGCLPIKVGPESMKSGWNGWTAPPRYSVSQGVSHLLHLFGLKHLSLAVFKHPIVRINVSDRGSFVADPDNG